MTTERETPEQYDELQQDQEALDQEQGIEQLAALAPLTQDDVRVMLNQHAQGLNRQMQGLQSLLDKGLNAIRRDSEDARRQDHVRSQQQALLSLVPEEDRDRAETILRQQSEAAQADVASTTSVMARTTDGSAGDSQITSEQASQVYQDFLAVVEDTGLNPTAMPRDDLMRLYEALSDAQYSERERRREFFRLADGMKQRPARPARASAVPPQQRQPNPPTDGAPIVRGGFRTSDDVVEAFTNGKLTTEKYRSEMLRFGETI